MPRKMKKGLDAYPFDTDLFQDMSVRKLIKCQGAKAVAVYTCLLCNIYANGYYILWDNKMPFSVSESLGVDEAFVGEVVECCVRLDLFNGPMYRDKRVLTSSGIQQRYIKEVARLRRIGGTISEYSLIDSPQLDMMLNSPLWLAKVKRDYNLTDDELSDLLSEWSKNVVANGKQHASTQDAKRHFENWCAKILSSNASFSSKNNKNNEQYPNSKPSRRRPDRQVTAATQDFTTSF